MWARGSASEGGEYRSSRERRGGGGRRSAGRGVEDEEERDDQAEKGGLAVTEEGAQTNLLTFCRNTHFKSDARSVPSHTPLLCFPSPRRLSGFDI